VLQKKQGPVVDPRCARAEPAGIPQGVGLLFDVALLLLPLHAEWRIGQHVIKCPFFAVRVAVEPVLGKGVGNHDVVRILTLDEHVGFAYGPGLVVPVLAEELGMGLAVELPDISFGHGKHAAGAAGRIVDGFHHMTAGQILFRGQEQVDHQFDHLPGGEMLPGLLVGLSAPTRMSSSNT